MSLMELVNGQQFVNGDEFWTFENYKAESDLAIVRNEQNKLRIISDASMKTVEVVA